MSEYAPHQVEEFISLYANNQRRLLEYIVTLVHNVFDAEDLLQQSSLVLWRKFQTYRSGTDFYHWACRIAFLEVKNFLRTRGNRNVWLSDELLNELSEEQIVQGEQYETYREYLPQCLERLSEKDRNLVQLCYAGDGSFRDVALRIGMKTNTVYQALRRIRRALLDCIERALSLDRKFSDRQVFCGPPVGGDMR